MYLDIIFGVVAGVVVIVIVVVLAVLLKMDKLSRRPFEVVIYSIIPLQTRDMWQRVFTYIVVWLIVAGTLIMLPLSFAIVGGEMVPEVVTAGKQWGDWEVCKEPEDLFFEIFGGFSMNYSEGTVMLAWTTVWWVFFDMIVSIFVVYRNMAKINPFNDVGPCCLTALILFFQVVFQLFDVLGLFFDTGQAVFSVFLTVWPVANFIRLADVVVTLIFRSNVFFLSKCYKKTYNGWFFALDVVGTSGGFLMANDPFWEKVVTVVTEIIDFAFSLTFVLFDYDVAVSLSTRNTLAILKIVALALKVTLSFKNYVSVGGSYLLSLLTGALLGVAVFISFLLLQLLSMRLVNDDFTHVEIMVPLLLIIGFMTVLFGLCSRTDVPYSASAFEPGKGGEGEGEGRGWMMSWDGECIRGAESD